MLKNRLLKLEKKLEDETATKKPTKTLADFYQDIKNECGLLDQYYKKAGEEIREREKELNGLKCPNCTSQNIHKKDKRQRRTFKVKRYQCMDCKKVFQVKIEDERTPTLF